MQLIILKNEQNRTKNESLNVLAKKLPNFPVYCTIADSWIFMVISVSIRGVWQLLIPSLQNKIALKKQFFTPLIKQNIL